MFRLFHGNFLLSLGLLSILEKITEPRAPRVTEYEGRFTPVTFWRVIFIIFGVLYLSVICVVWYISFDKVNEEYKFFPAMYVALIGIVLILGFSYWVFRWNVYVEYKHENELVLKVKNTIRSVRNAYVIISFVNLILTITPIFYFIYSTFYPVDSFLLAYYEFGSSIITIMCLFIFIQLISQIVKFKKPISSISFIRDFRHRSQAFSLPSEDYGDEYKKMKLKMKELYIKKEKLDEKVNLQDEKDIILNEIHSLSIKLSSFDRIVHN